MYYIVCKNIQGILLSNSNCIQCIENRHCCEIKNVSYLSKRDVEKYKKVSIAILDTKCYCKKDINIKEDDINNGGTQVHKKVP